MFTESQNPILVWHQPGSYISLVPRTFQTLDMTNASNMYQVLCIIIGGYLYPSLVEKFSVFLRISVDYISSVFVPGNLFMVYTSIHF